MAQAAAPPCPDPAIAMYVHLGGDVVVAVADVVAIVDVRLTDYAEVNREFLDRAIAAKRVYGEGSIAESKALVVTYQGVFTSGISVATLARRMQHVRQEMLTWGGEK